MRKHKQREKGKTFIFPSGESHPSTQLHIFNVSKHSLAQGNLYLPTVRYTALWWSGQTLSLTKQETVF